MKHLSAVALALALSLGASGRAALAQAPVVRCDVVVQSQTGGMIEVQSGPEAAAPPQIIWRPAPSNRIAELLVAYADSSLAALSEPTGLYIRFPMEAQAPADSTVLNIRTQNGRYWRFVGQGHEKADAEFGFVEFGKDLAYGRALLSAVADGQMLTISLEHYDRTVGSTVFGTGSQRARDILLDQAKRKFEAGDPTMCKRS